MAIFTDRALERDLVKLSIFLIAVDNNFIEVFALLFIVGTKRSSAQVLLEFIGADNTRQILLLNRPHNLTSASIAYFSDLRDNVS
jgi:hypothetical protein